MKYCFVCPHCKQYNVDEMFFEGVLTPSLVRQLHEKITEGSVIAAVMHFKDGCPHCEMGKSHRAQLKIVKIKRIQRPAGETLLGFLFTLEIFVIQSSNMTYIFLDESGDLGFGKHSTRWFVITIAVISDFRPLEKVVKKIWRSLPKKYKKHGELHANYHDNTTRRKMLKELARIDELKILYVVINKENVPIEKRDEENLYAYATQVLLDRAQSLNVIYSGKQISLCADRRGTKKKFQEYFVNNVSSLMANRNDLQVSISLETSHKNKSLQAVDFISWSIFRKYERGDDMYYKLLEKKLINETILYQ